MGLSATKTVLQPNVETSKYYPHSFNFQGLYATIKQTKNNASLIFNTY